MGLQRYKRWNARTRCYHHLLIYVFHTHLVASRWRPKLRNFCWPILWRRLVDVRYLLLSLLVRKITGCISHTPTDSELFVAAVGNPCGKQHFREIATPDWVRTLRRCEHTHQYVRFVNWLTQSGVALSRKCCFPPGLGAVNFYTYKSIITQPTDHCGKQKSCTFAPRTKGVWKT